MQDEKSERKSWSATQQDKRLDNKATYYLNCQESLFNVLPYAVDAAVYTINKPTL